MPLFSSPSVFDPEVEKATDECNTTEDWQLILDICDKIKATPNGSKEALKAIMKRVTHRVPHVSIQALTLLDACVNNCGKPFQLELCTREWINDARNLLQKCHPKVSEKLKELIEKWSEEFKNDSQLNLLPQFYRKLKSEGVAFTKSEPDTKGKSKQQELEFKEDLDLAIALSLQDSGPTPSKQAPSPSSNIYPSTSNVSSAPEREPLKARALYDFEAAEDNELSFKAGEIILVSDDSDQNWWKGEGTRGEGLFPANFVTTDLNKPPPEEPKKEKKKVRFQDQQEKKQVKATRPKTVIREDQLESCLAMLKNASPTEEDDEEETIRDLEEICAEMAPLIDQKITDSDRKQKNLDELNQQFIRAITMYQQSMKEPIPAPTLPVYSSNQVQFQQARAMPGYIPPQYQPQQMYSNQQLPQSSMHASVPYGQVPAGMMPVVSMESYSSHGPTGMPQQQQQFVSYQQDVQSYQDGSYYATNAVQEAYAQPQQNMVYDYNQQPQHGQMYSQATVYQ